MPWKIVSVLYCLEIVSNRRASDLWRTILDAVEAGHIQNEATTGLVFDLEKAYNTLPRLPTLHALAILGVPQQVLQAWASALANIERFFVVQWAVLCWTVQQLWFCRGLRA